MKRHESGLIGDFLEQFNPNVGFITGNWNPFSCGCGSPAEFEFDGHNERELLGNAYIKC